MDLISVTDWKKDDQATSGLEDTEQRYDRLFNEQIEKYVNEILKKESEPKSGIESSPSSGAVNNITAEEGTTDEFEPSIDDL